MTDVAPDLVPVSVAAARLGIGDTTYRRAAAAGQVPPIVRIRGVARVGVKALDRYIDQLTLAASDPAPSPAAGAAGSDTGGVGTPIHTGAGEQSPATPTTNNGGTT